MIRNGAYAGDRFDDIKRTELDCSMGDFEKVVMVRNIRIKKFIKSGHAACVQSPTQRYSNYCISSFHQDYGILWNLRHAHSLYVDRSPSPYSPRSPLSLVPADLYPESLHFTADMFKIDLYQALSCILGEGASKGLIRNMEELVKQIKIFKKST